jgi:hypothetical protein
LQDGRLDGVSLDEDCLVDGRIAGDKRGALTYADRARTTSPLCERRKCMAVGSERSSSFICGYVRMGDFQVKAEVGDLQQVRCLPSLDRSVLGVFRAACLTQYVNSAMTTKASMICTPVFAPRALLLDCV